MASQYHFSSFRVTATDDSSAYIAIIESNLPMYGHLSLNLHCNEHVLWFKIKTPIISIYIYMPLIIAVRVIMAPLMTLARHSFFFLLEMGLPCALWATHKVKLLAWSSHRVHIFCIPALVSPSDSKFSISLSATHVKRYACGTCIAPACVPCCSNWSLSNITGTVQAFSRN